MPLAAPRLIQDEHGQYLEVSDRRVALANDPYKLSSGYFDAS
jgi:hypothetical protein